MSSKEGYKKIYDFLMLKANEKCCFSIDEMSKFTGLKESSLKVYFRNKLRDKYIEESENGIIATSKIFSITQNKFINYLCQKTLKTVINDFEFQLFLNSKNALLAGIEIHNKPIFSYRYQIVTILIINAWELLLKAYISKNMKNIKFMFEDGRTKPFDECVKCVFETLGKDYFIFRDNLLLLYNYRCKFIHYYTEDLNIVLFSLLQKSILLYIKFIKTFFDYDISEIENFHILPIGFSKPFSPIDYITNNSAIKNVSSEVKNFILDILDKTKKLASINIHETIFVPFSIHYENEARLKNADIVAAINNNENVKISINKEISFTSDSNAKKVRIDEESLFNDIFTETYADICAYCKKKFSNFKRNFDFNDFMKKIKENQSLHKKRFLTVNNPESQSRSFYSKDVYKKLEEFYATKN